MSSNLSVNKKTGIVEASVNPDIYPLDIIYSAAYVFLDRAYVLLKGDPAKEVVVELKPKKTGYDLEKLGLEFNDQLLNYAAYKTLSEKSLEVKQMLMHEIFSHVVEKNNETQTPAENYAADNIIDDPEGILIPWEEKYGKKSGKQKRSDKAR